MKRFEWNSEKNKEVKRRHGISFDEIVTVIKKGKRIKTITHPNQKRYPGQKIIVIKLKEYLYAVPYIEDEEKRFLKTLYPGRKLTKLFMKERKK